MVCGPAAALPFPHDAGAGALPDAQLVGKAALPWSQGLAVVAGHSVPTPTTIGSAGRGSGLRRRKSHFGVRRGAAVQAPSGRIAFGRLAVARLLVLLAGYFTVPRS